MTTYPLQISVDNDGGIVVQVRTAQGSFYQLTASRKKNQCVESVEAEGLGGLHVPVLDGLPSGS